jgi:hypothetical protein
VAERKKEEAKTDEECGDAGTDQQTQMSADGLALAPDFPSTTPVDCARLQLHYRLEPLFTWRRVITVASSDVARGCKR